MFWTFLVIIEGSIHKPSRALTSYLFDLVKGYTHPIGEQIEGFQPLFSSGSCFPVAPNIVLTTKHTLEEEDFLRAGYQVD